MDISHYYIKKGSGEPLILLHGNGEDCGYFINQLEELSNYYRVIALDTRGHGKTPRGDAPFTIRQFAEDLAGFMDRIAVEKANILGFSDGANIAMYFSIAYPQRVEKLILNGGNLNPAGVKRHIQIPIETGYRIATLFASRSKDARKNAEMLGLMVNEPHISLSELSAITAETLVIAGTKDMITERHSRLIAESITNAKLVFIDGNHFIANNNFVSFNKEILGFLKKQVSICDTNTNTCP